MKKNTEKRDRRTAREKNPERPLSTKEKVALAKNEGLIKRAVREVKDRSAQKEMERTARTRAIHKERWDDICGGPYTLDHPVVSLEWKMCEWRFLSILMKGDLERAFKELTPEEQDIYMNGYPPLGIGPYRSVEEASLVNASLGAFKRNRKIKVDLCEAHQNTEKSE